MCMDYEQDQAVPMHYQNSKEAADCMAFAKKKKK